MLKPKPITLDENTLILDTETTGLGSAAEICEISIIDALGNIKFNSLIKPINPIPEEAIKIHGITNEMVADCRAPKFEQIHTGLALILAGKNLIIYNKNYDLKIIDQVNKRCNFPQKFFDTLHEKTTCAMRHYSEFKNQAKWSKLTDACESMGIDITQFKAHRALADCQMTLELVKCMNDPEYIKTIKKQEEKHMETKSVEIIEKPKTSISEVVFDIEFTPSVINFDESAFNTSISDVISPVKDLGNNVTKEVLKDTLAKLRKFQNEISNRRIAIINDIKAPITDFEAKIKKGDAEIEQYISKYDANLKQILAKEKVAKHAEIEKLLPDIIENNNLDKEHALKLTIFEEYYLAKWTREKIIIDLVRRAEELFKQQDYIRVQEELKNTQIESRTRLIEQLNKEYNMKFTYSTLPINLFNDPAVHEHYNKAQIERQNKINENAKIEEIKSRGAESRIENNLSIQFGNNEPVEIEALREPYKSIIEDAKQNIEEINISNGIPSHKLVGIIPKGFTPTGECNIYQNLRLGANSQSEIIAAVAKLKAEGLSVEFI